MSVRPAPGLFADRDVFGLPPLVDAIPDAVLIGLATLATSAPLWGDEHDWRALVDRLQAFAARWYCPATAAGWLDVQLFGLDPIAPRARVGRMGAAFLVGLRGHQVISVDHRAIEMVARTSARLRVYRDEPDSGAALAWTLAKV
jgi:hypothetical protein